MTRTTKKQEQAFIEQVISEIPKLIEQISDDLGHQLRFCDIRFCGSKMFMGANFETGRESLRFLSTVRFNYSSVKKMPSNGKKYLVLYADGYWEIGEVEVINGRERLRSIFPLTCSNF